MKKVFFSFTSVLFLLLGLVFVSLSSTNAFAIENDTSYKDGQIISESDSLDEQYLKYVTEDDIPVLSDNTDNSINPLADEIVKSKTITVFYSSRSSVPDFYFYREYSEGHWFSGHLPLIRIEITSGGWEATFSGKIFAFVE